MKTKQYLRRSIKLLFGLVLYAVGIVFIIQANIGLAPWDAFHIGLTYISNFSFGIISILVGLVVLVFTFFLDEPIGIGTIANTVLIGLLIDLINYLQLIPLFDSTWSGVLIMILGMELIAIGTYFYVGSAFGTGPRDGLMVALTRKTNFPVGLIRATIEISVLAMGWLLGAPIGIGTAIVAFGMGPLIQITFQILHFDVNKVTHDAFLVKKRKKEDVIKDIKKYKVSAFEFNKKGGNPAGVVLDADNLSEKEMLLIASQLGFSETAFIMNSKLADFRLRFFTPLAEVDLCGHATIASFNLLRDLHIISTGEYTQETKAGILKIFIYDTYVLMEQTKPSYHEILRPEELLPCFKNEEDLFLENFPIQIVSTGLKDIIVPIKNLKTLLHTNLNMDAVQRISQKYGVVGIHAFSLETIEDNYAHARNFAPLYGIDEESATGTASGALASYLKKYQGHACPNHLIFEQGDHMNSPSRIKVQLTMNETAIKRIHVGGSARLI